MASSEGKRPGNSQTVPPGGSSEMGTLLNQLPPSVRSVVKITTYSQIFNWWGFLGAIATVGVFGLFGVLRFAIVGGADLVDNVGISMQIGFVFGMLVVGPLLGAGKVFKCWRRDRVWRQQ